MRNAVYPGSFDPLTLAHLNIIERTAPLFDELIVVVADDPKKKYLFTSLERSEMVRNTTTHIPNVRVEVSPGGYVVHFAETLGATVLIRGIRNTKDLEEEQVLATENRHISQAIETFWLPSLPELAHISATLVRGHMGLGPDWEHQVSRSVPAFVVEKLKEKYTLNRARYHWQKLMEVMGNPPAGEVIFQDLVRHLSEPQRIYHTLPHIVAMLDEAEEVGEYEPLLLLTIWVHDAIYAPHSTTNEVESAVLGRVIAQRLGMASILAERVSTLILATQHKAVPTDHLSQVLVDLDLAILGKSDDEFDSYELAIRREYAWVPEETFHSARANILQSFLDRPRIYSTEYCYKKYEVAARRNLTRSIEKLRS